MKLYRYGFFLVLVAGLQAQEIKDIPEPAPIEKPVKPPAETPVVAPANPAPAAETRPAVEKTEKPADPEAPAKIEKKEEARPVKPPEVIRLKTEAELKAEEAKRRAAALEKKRRAERRVERPVRPPVPAVRPVAPAPGPAQQMLERTTPAAPPREVTPPATPVLPAIPAPAEGLSPVSAIAPAMPATVVTPAGPVSGIADTHYLPEAVLIPGLKVTHYTLSNAPVANLDHGVQEGEVEDPGEGIGGWILGKMTNSRTLRNIFIVAAILAVFLVYRMRNTGQRIGL